MSRLLALVGAVAMIVAAVVVRGMIDGGDGDAPGRPATAADVVCAFELAEFCPVGGSVEDASLTAERLVQPGASAAAWLTFEPWPTMVDDARVRAGLDPLFEDIEPLASSPLVAVVVTDKADCDWRCIGEQREVGARPLGTGIGLLHLGAAAVGFIGGPDFATNDIPGPFRAYLDAFVDAVEPVDDPVRRMLQTRGAEFGTALSHEAEAKPEYDAAAESNRARLALTYPAPVIYAVAVAAGATPLLDGVADDMAAAGWQKGTNPSGLPSAGVMTALRGLL